MKIRMNCMEALNYPGHWIPDGVMGDGYLVDPFRRFLWMVKNRFMIFYLGKILDFQRIKRKCLTRPEN